MFVDASALVAILLEEEGFEHLAAIIDCSDDSITSPIAIWETVVRLRSLLRLEASEVSDIVSSYCEIARIRLVTIGPEETTSALDAFDRFGKGRHPAKLNMGDCFAYGCARANGRKLLFVGNDFSQTDIRSALQAN